MTEPQDTVDRLGLKIRAQFVPFSRSRNTSEKSPSLNWKVTLVRVHGPDNETGRDILTTDYMAGAGHCPAYKASVKRLGGHDSILRAEHIAWECETGKKSSLMEHFGPSGNEKIEPNPLDVIASLVKRT